MASKPTSKEKAIGPLTGAEEVRVSQRRQRIWKNFRLSLNTLLAWIIQQIQSSGAFVQSIAGVNSVLTTPNPITSSGTVQLVNDSAAPGNSKYYGTNSLGVLGYQDFPTPAPALPYKSYVVYLAFNNFTNPVTTIQYNTFTQSMTWTRTANGTFRLTNGGTEFTVGKTWVHVGRIPIVSGDPLEFYFLEAFNTSTSIITVTSSVLFINAGTIEKAVTDASNSSGTVVEVRVYP